MHLDWLEQKLEYKQRKRLRKLINNLIEIVYVNAVFAFMMMIMLSPLIIFSYQAITLQDQVAIVTHHQMGVSNPTENHKPQPRVPRVSLRA